MMSDHIGFEPEQTYISLLVLIPKLAAARGKSETGAENPKHTDDAA